MFDVNSNKILTTSTKPIRLDLGHANRSLTLFDIQNIYGSGAAHKRCTHR